MPLYKKDLLNLLANQTGDETEEWINQFGNELLYEESEIKEIEKNKKLLYEDLLDCQNTIKILNQQLINLKSLKEVGEAIKIVDYSVIIIDLKNQIKNLEKENQNLKSEIKFLDEECNQKFMIEIKKLKSELKNRISLETSNFLKNELESYKNGLNEKGKEVNRLEKINKELLDFNIRFRNENREYKQICEDSQSLVDDYENELRNNQITIIQFRKQNQELKTYIKLLADKKKLQEDKEMPELMETKLGKK